MKVEGHVTIPELIVSCSASGDKHTISCIRHESAIFEVVVWTVDSKCVFIHERCRINLTIDYFDAARVLYSHLTRQNNIGTVLHCASLETKDKLVLPIDEYVLCEVTHDVYDVPVATDLVDCILERFVRGRLTAILHLVYTVLKTNVHGARIFGHVHFRCSD